MKDLKFLKLKNGEEVLSVIQYESNTVVLYRPAVLYYDTLNELTLSSWLWQTDEEIFRMPQSELLVQPTNPIQDLVDTYERWNTDVNGEIQDSIFPMGTFTDKTH